MPSELRRCLQVLAETARRAAKWAAVQIVAALAASLGGLILYNRLAPHGIDIVGLQTAGSVGDAAKVILNRVEDYRTAVQADLPLILGYTIALVTACRLGARIFWTGRFAGLAWTGMWLSLAASLFNLGQDVLLLIALTHFEAQGRSMFIAIQALAFAKFATLAVAAPIAACSVAVAIWRLVTSASTRSRWVAAGASGNESDNPKQPPLIPPAPLEAASLSALGADADSRARRDNGKGLSRPSDASERYWAQNATLPPGRKTGGIGICVSGGGIRSACVTLGALQSLREHHILQKADYLVSVSGGGYTAGAFQLALHPNGNAADAEDIFASGSVEEDHLRRHSSYLADGFRQWMVALGVILRGLLASVLLIGLAVVSVGVVIAWFYRVTDTARLAALRPSFLGPPLANAFPRPSTGVVVACAAFGAAAAISYFLELFFVSTFGGGAVFARAARSLTGTTVLLVVAGIGIPILVWASSWLSYHVGWVHSPGSVGTTGTVAVILSYLGTLAGTLLRKAKPVVSGAGSKRGFLSKVRSSQLLPYSMLQMLLMWVCLILLCIAFLLASGWVAASGASRNWWWLAPIGLLLVLGSLLDQTWLSLHPFYRRRLASELPHERCPRNGFVASPEEVRQADALPATIPIDEGGSRWGSRWWNEKR